VEPSLVGLEPPLLPSIRPPEAGHAVSPRTERRLLRLERSRERCAQPRQVCDHNGGAGPRHSCRGAERPGGSEPTPCRGQKLRNRVPSVAASCPCVCRILACRVCTGRFARRREVPKGVHRRRERRPRGARPENRVVCLRGDLRDTEHAGARRAAWRAPQISAIFCFKRIRGQQKIPSGCRRRGTSVGPNNQQAVRPGYDLWSTNQGLGGQNLVALLRDDSGRVGHVMSERHGSPDLPGICG
jgi:hypothetical protein